MFKLRLFLLYLVFHSALHAQWYDPEKVNKKARFIYSGAVHELQEGNMESGKLLLRRAIAQDPRFVEAWLSMAGASGELKQYDSAVFFFDKSWNLDSVYSRDLLLPHSINLVGLGRFAEARDAVVNFLGQNNLGSRSRKAGEFRLASYLFAVEYEKKYGKPDAFTPINLGDSINSAKSEYYPSFTINDSLLVFTRRGEGFREDFLRSIKRDESYTLATRLDGALNTEPSKGGLIVSQDAQWLIFAGNFSRSGFGDFDLYLCDATPQGWSEPYNLGEAINTEFWESSPSLSPDKQTLFFSSNRPGGHGGKDLYVSHRKSNGQWGMAENMGPNFNTAADDLAPFIHADNRTLFFTSGGHPGYGGSDIYLSRKGPGGDWSVPQNLGYPINTIDDDGSLSVAANGHTAYFASFRSDSRGGLDLYKFDLPKHDQPLQTLWVEGKVFDAKTGKGIPSAIELKNLTTGETLQKVVTNETGYYLVTLPKGTDYTFTVNRNGYLFFSDQFLLAEHVGDSTYRNDIALEPIAVNTAMELKNILFETNAFRLQPTSFVELDKLVNLMTENPGLKVQINGHTDNVGKPADNLLLSTNRAKSVVDYLVSKGIDKTRLSFKGFGATKPMADNTTEAGKAKNRRTEMMVTGN